MKKMLIMSLFLAGMFAIVSCGDDDETPDPDLCGTADKSYNGEIKAIIDASCAYSGCHDGTGTNMSIPAGSDDLTNYAGLGGMTSSGSFNTRVLVDKTMPPADFVPPGSPTTLTQTQLDLLTCWMEDGYPE